MENLYCVTCNTYRKFEKKKESTEILHIPGLISNIEGYQKK